MKTPRKTKCQLTKSACELRIETSMHTANYNNQHQKELLKLCPCKISGTQLFPPEWETREQYCRWFHELVTNGSFGLERMIFLGNARLALNGNMQAGTITDTDVWKIPMQFTMFPCMTLHSQSSMH